MKPAKPRTREKLAAWARSLTPTAEEQFIVAAILLSLLAGAVVTHYRHEYRLGHPAQASPTPRYSARESAQ